MKKIFLALVASSFSLMSMSSMAAYNAGYGHVTSITADTWGNCSFEFFIKTTGYKRTAFWSCTADGGKNMLFVAESAQDSNKEIQISVSNRNDGKYELHSITMH